MTLPRPARDTTVVVTGASSGIGAAAAREFSSRGYHVTVVARRAARLKELAASMPGEARVVPCDLSDPSAREALLKEIADGPVVAGLCNSAGLGGFGAVHERDLATECGMVALNVGSTHHLTAALVPGMVERGAGAVLNVSSGAGYGPIPWTTTYSATKAFVNTFSRALHTELKGTGVSVTALCPGPVRTEFMDAADASDYSENMPDWMWGTAESTARAGIQGMIAGRPIVNPKVTDKITMAAASCIPDTVMMPLLHRVMRRRFTA